MSFIFRPVTFKDKDSYCDIQTRYAPPSALNVKADTFRVIGIPNTNCQSSSNCKLSLHCNGKPAVHAIQNRMQTECAFAARGLSLQPTHRTSWCGAAYVHEAENILHRLFEIIFALSCRSALLPASELCVFRIRRQDRFFAIRLLPLAYWHIIYQNPSSRAP